MFLLSTEKAPLGTGAKFQVSVQMWTVHKPNAV